MEDKSNDINDEKINLPICYKCKKKNASVSTREKSCKDCFLLLVEYTFKNTLREKCLFKSKPGFCNYKEKGKTEQMKKNDNTNSNINNNEKNKYEDKIPIMKNKHIDENFQKTNGPNQYSKNDNTLESHKNKKKTTIAFSGEICSSILLYLFIKYLQSAKNKKNDMVLMNEHAIFSEVIFVDIFDDETYILKLIKIIEEIFKLLGKNNDKKNVEIEEGENSTQREDISSITHKDKITFNKGVFKKKINKIYFTVLKSNYFIKEEHQGKFLQSYDIVKKEKNYYLNYINELIIYNNILKYCKDEQINYVLWGNNANNISNKSFLYTIIGNGINIPLCTSYIDNRYEPIKFIKPLKDLLDKEIYIYAFYKDIKYAYNKIFDGNILYSAINNLLSNLDSKNNTTSIVNNTCNHLVNLMDYTRKDQKIVSHSCESNYDKIEKRDDKSINWDNNGASNDTNENEKESSLNCDETKSSNNNIYEHLNNYNKNSLCYICSGNKETPEEKNFINKMNKIQTKYIIRMKYTDNICSTCLNIFSSNESFFNLFDALI
ncbi:cytoplasmic tRNA 2-thiolation protein 2, putative [Plasmodium vinckei brucechwatti]|uniref:Cytoplasmic tRNA 2-thiolation protein 2, putative n=1 Tax=Plasmodium vinckei brucechwatti TaxID=119398 RepID=A0A6V7SKX6_PLAVN|nr:cytoplasmic tRNA 2-thiolation protein 2, putative [Plasmodium vinckei brucechwatti]